MQAVTYVGQRFGRLVAIERLRVDGITRYRCLCDCGTERIVRYTSLFGGHARSCGCLKLEVLHRRKMPDKEIRVNEIWRYYRRNAKLRNVVWGLDKPLFRSLLNRSCAYCGYHRDLCGIDRVDNLQGYTSSNCVPCCRWCNWGKNERSLVEFKQWVRDLYGHVFHSR